MKLWVNKSSPIGTRLAYRFWIELDSPQRFASRKIMEAWTPKMKSLWRQSGLDYPAFKWFLIWCLRKQDSDGAKYGNDYTACNLRAARDPMASLVKQFPITFFEIFMPKADKVIPILIQKREQEEAETRLAADAQKPLRYVDILVEDASEALLKNAQDLDKLDAAFPMREPMEGEDMEQWVMRETRPLRNPDWRCSRCKYGVSLDGVDDVRTQWCGDCWEERMMDAEEDVEWMRFEAPSESCLTREWE